MPLLFELIPPPLDATAENIQATIDAIALLLEETLYPISGLNIPEIRPESRHSPRPQNFVPKIPPRDFAVMLRNALSDPPEIIINRVVVHAPREAQARWLYRTYHDYSISHIVLVGGESSQIRYPGPSVTETARLVTQNLNRGIWPYGRTKKVRPTKIIPGGITIPSRRRPNPEEDEPARLIYKIKSGIQFFTTQVLYEAESVGSLLRDYHRACLSEGLKPAPVYLSFAPVSSQSDVQFLKWLGVEIPDAIEKELLTGWIGTGMRSVRVSERILNTILELVDQEDLSVPLGLNIEHVTSRNFEIAIEMINRLSGIMYRYNRVVDPTEQAEVALQLAGLDPDEFEQGKRNRRKEK